MIKSLIDDVVMVNYKLIFVYMSYICGFFSLWSGYLRRRKEKEYKERKMTERKKKGKTIGWFLKSEKKGE
jgi:hypothetical protein